MSSGLNSCLEKKIQVVPLIVLVGRIKLLEVLD